MGIDEFKARLDQLFAEAGPAGSPRQEARGLHDALVDLKVAIKDLRDALTRTQRELGVEQEQLATALRRGELADGIQDAETAAIAREYAEKHRQRVELLERKVGVQRDEVALAEREHEGLSERYRAAKQGVGGSGTVAPPPVEDSDLLKTRLDRQAVEAAAQAQLELLKKKMGRTS